jgi:hypothetical protein
MSDEITDRINDKPDFGYGFACKRESGASSENITCGYSDHAPKDNMFWQVPSL